jgi:hypothetical protein
MPKGGLRPKAGRPKGSIGAKYQVTADSVGVGPEYMPIEYMLALMRDEKAEPNRRDAMAVQAAPYCHPKLNAVATTNADGRNAVDVTNIVQIYSVPRGAAFDPKSGTIAIEDNATSVAIEPFIGTPPLKGDADATEQPPAAEQPPVAGAPQHQRHAEPLPVVELDTANVTRLDAYRDGRDD